MITEAEFNEVRQSGATVYEVGSSGYIEPIVFERRAKWNGNTIETTMSGGYNMISYPRDNYISECDAISAAIQIVDLQIAELMDTQKDLKDRLWRIIGNPNE